jgi:2-polyprenyl-3-methyl-5-hydroxy-6-metoxy-1,4-benzoquinol methylase
MSSAGYDAIAAEYAAGIVSEGPQPQSVNGVAAGCLLALLGPLAGVRICDLGCGEGYLARWMAERGGSVVAVDISQRMLEVAQQRTGDPAIQFVCDDAQELTMLTEGSFDLVVSNLALMDIPNLQATYNAVHRVLRPGGRFVFTITHPCFQSPNTSMETDDEGHFVARRLVRYAEEGFWRSGSPDTLRGKVGAYHRTLSTYLNQLLQAGFRLGRLVEPTLPPGRHETPSAQAQVLIPSVLVVEVFC